MEKAGDVSKLDTRIDSVGRQQPAHRPPSKEQQLRALRERSALPPIVPESQRPAPGAALPPAAVPVEPIKSMDEHDLDKALHRGRLSLGHALADRPKEALGIVLDLIGRLDLANKLPRNQRIDFARGFVSALGLTPADLGE